jgi:hypothetical protein
LTGESTTREVKIMDARARAQAEYELMGTISRSLTAEEREVWLAMRDRVGKWAEYHTVLLQRVETCIHCHDQAQDDIGRLESLNTIRATVEEWGRAVRRMNETLDADHAIPRC